MASCQKDICRQVITAKSDIFQPPSSRTARYVPRECPSREAEYTARHSPSELANQASLLAVRAEKAMLTADRELQEITETIRKMVNLRSQKLAAAREARESWKRAARRSFHYMAAAAAKAAGMRVTPT